MSNDLKKEQLCSAVTGLLTAERQIVDVLTRVLDSVHQIPAAVVAIQKAQSLAGEHSSSLAAYLATKGPQEGGEEPVSIIPMPLVHIIEIKGLSIPSTLQAGHAMFSSAALSYAALFELALRLYEPPLRELAPRHLKAYIKVAHGLAGMIPAAVARELEDRTGLGCHCICPMCGMGACGCVALGKKTIITGWQEALAGEAEAGFPLQPPRADTPLAGAGVAEGERLLEIDGQAVQSIPEIQAALRKHTFGEEVLLRVGKDASTSRELRVRHVSDYPIQ